MDPFFVKNCLHRRQIKKNSSKKGVFRHLVENFHKKLKNCVFSTRFLPSKLFMLATNAPSEKFLVCSAKNECHKVIPKSGPFKKFATRIEGRGGGGLRWPLVLILGTLQSMKEYWQHHMFFRLFVLVFPIKNARLNHGFMMIQRNQKFIRLNLNHCI